MTNFWNHLIDIVLALNELKQHAIQNNDTRQKKHLKNKYPELFGHKFGEFLESIEETILYFKRRDGIDFSDILNPHSLKTKNDLMIF